MSSRRSRSSRSPQPPPPPRTDVLENMRVLNQSDANPFHTPDIPPTSRTFRVVAFSFNLAMFMLESPRGNDALLSTGNGIWNVFGRRQRRTTIFQGDESTMPAFVNKFLAKCRADPPTIIVSDRITGEGLAERVDWQNVHGAKEDVYSAKWAALFRLNKTVINNAILAAEDNDKEDFHKFLFLLSVSVAHELVHLFVGFMLGDSGRSTPAEINHPAGQAGSQRLGESGRYWEGKFLGHCVEAFYDETHPRGLNQPGIFYTNAHTGRGFKVDHRSIEDYLKLKFAYQIGLVADRGGKGSGPSRA
ncbi:hypothetical protein AK830_g7871 [Neonectria ditissima]|uniref:Uncharacterized protein n=1 Tax=Neonectria ditissima TaxID=78410 RepID=A0A0P7B956_9HYPO|nr:hypothetical protein AK830_g7871 [Neonectria ditissima]